MFINLSHKHLNLNRKASQLATGFLLMLVLHSVAAAVELSFNGFATLGATYIQHDHLNYRSSLLNRPRDGFSLATDSVVGAQINAAFNEQWESVGQIVVQDRADTSALNYVEKAFVRYKFNRNWIFRVGRLDSNFYMLSDFRAVGYAYLWARPPVDFYSGTSVAAVSDGMDIQYTTDVGSGVAKLSVLYGQASARLNDEGVPLRADFNELAGLNMEYLANNWQLKVTYATAKIKNYEFGEFDEFIQAFRSVPTALWPQAPELIDEFDPEGDRAEFISVGFKFDNSEWQVQAEIATFQADWILFPNSKFGYLSIGYAIEQFTPYLLVAANRPDSAYTEVQAPTLPPETPLSIVQNIGLIAAIAEETSSNQFVDQNTLSFGTRYDFKNDWVVKFQFDHIRFQSPGTGLMGNNSIDLPSTPQRMNVVHLSFSTIF